MWERTAPPARAAGQAAFPLVTQSSSGTVEQNWIRFHPSEPTGLSQVPAQGKEPQPSPKPTMNLSSQGWGTVCFVLLFER